MIKFTYVIALQLFITCYAYAQIQFLPWQYIHTGSRATSLAIGDLNNDGLNDVAITTGYDSDPQNDYKVFVFYQDAFGYLSIPIKNNYPQNSYFEARSIAINDVNNDNLNDLIIGYDDSVGIYYQNLSGALNQLVSFYSGNLVDGLKSGDLNNDGLSDIAVSHDNEYFIKVFYQSNTGGFTTNTYPALLAGYNEIDIGDVNGDDLEDIIFMPGQFYKGIRVYQQDSLGVLGNPITYNYTSPPLNSLNGIAVGDLNNDGKNDVVGTGGGNTPDPKVKIWIQDTLTTMLQSPLTVQAYDNPSAIELGDFNNDGKNELSIVHGGWNSVSIFEQDITGNYNTFQLFSVPYASHYKAQGMSVGDLNNDGKKDIALADYNTGLILLYNNSIITSKNDLLSINQENILVSPNPINNYLSIVFPENKFNFKVSLYNSLGKLVYSTSNVNSNLRIELSFLVPGLYTVEVASQDRIQKIKVIKLVY